MLQEKFREVFSKKDLRRRLLCISEKGNYLSIPSFI